ncbi:MAG TPA: hypothetical protein VNO50_09980 [Pyrinomonadaceae bacterium]|nr:hypothetical protein [Pyrinomonadaceae bacterium]
MLKHFFSWLLQIFVPYALLIIGFLLLKVGRGQNKFEKAFDLGYDACILGFGIAAVLLGGPEFQAFLQVNNAATAPLIIGALSLAGFVVLERSGYSEVTKARTSILAGTFIFGANTAMVAWLDQRLLNATLFWGIMCWVLPCVVFWFIIRKPSKSQN